MRSPCRCWCCTGLRIASRHPTSVATYLPAPLTMQGSERLYQAAQTEDKQIELFEGFQHIMMRQGVDEVRRRPDGGDSPPLLSRAPRSLRAGRRQGSTARHRRYPWLHRAAFEEVSS